MRQIFANSSACNSFRKPSHFFLALGSVITRVPSHSVLSCFSSRSTLDSILCRIHAISLRSPEISFATDMTRPSTISVSSTSSRIAIPSFTRHVNCRLTNRTSLFPGCLITLTVGGVGVWLRGPGSTLRFFAGPTEAPCVFVSDFVCCVIRDKGCDVRPLGTPSGCFWSRRRTISALLTFALMRSLIAIC